MSVYQWLSLEATDCCTEHARLVYNLQEGENNSEDSDDPDNYGWASDDSHASSSISRRRRYVPKVRKRMSILSNQHFDIPSYENGFEYALPGKPDTRRRFFQSVARWDARSQQVIISRLGMDDMPSTSPDSLGPLSRGCPEWNSDDTSPEEGVDEMVMTSDEEDGDDRSAMVE